MSVLIVGSVAYDGLETPFGKVDRILGGSASYISLASSYFSQNNRLVGVVGNDFAESDIQKLRNRDIDLAGLQHDPSGKTFFWAGRYHFDLNSRDTLDTQLNVFERFNPVIPDAYRNSDIVCLGKSSRRCGTCARPDRQAQASDRRHHELLVEGAQGRLLDTQTGGCAHHQRFGGTRTFGRIEPHQGIEGHSRYGSDRLIIRKANTEPCSSRQISLLPAFPSLDLFDPTGAGDTFLGGSAVGSTAGDLSNANTARVVFGRHGQLLRGAVWSERLYDLDQSEIENRYTASDARNPS